MDWLHKLRRALLALSAWLKLRKSLGGGGGGGGGAGGVGGECGGGIGGLLKLQDDVQMCGYQDVQIMWNMLSKSQQETTTQPASKPNKKQIQKPSWSLRTFFLTSHAKTPVLVRLETCAVEKAKY